jgi:hypothetical protein
VQDVIAAINIEPSFIAKSVPLTFDIVCSFLLVACSNTFLKFVDASVSKTLS